MPYWWWYLGLFLFSLSLVLRIQDYFNKNSEAGEEDKEMKEKIVYLERRIYRKYHPRCTYHFHPEKPKVSKNNDYVSSVKKYILKEKDLEEYKKDISSYSGLDRLAEKLYTEMVLKETEEKAYDILKNLFKD